MIYMCLGAGLFVYFSKTASPSGKKLENEVILLLGKDDTGDSSRVDVLMLLGIDHSQQQLSLVSLPRDSEVLLACENRIDKIAHSYPAGETYWKNNGGGFACVSQSVENLLEIEKVYSAEVEMSAFASIVGSLAITLTPAQSFCQNSACFTANVPVTLDSASALAFVRHRSSFKDGDLTRIKNQQALVVAVLDKLQSLSTLERTKMIGQFWGKIKTNYPKLRLLDLMEVGQGMKYQKTTIKGSSYTRDKVSYYKLDNSDLAYYRAFYRKLLA